MWKDCDKGTGCGKAVIRVLDGIGTAVKNSLEIIIKQVRLEGGFKRGGRIRVAECLRKIVPDRWASVRKRSFTNNGCAYVVLGRWSSRYRSTEEGVY